VGQNSLTFRGFLVEARVSGDTSSESGGVFSVMDEDPDVQILGCSDQEAVRLNKL